MRSSKSRSRTNKTRNIRPTGGNIINRVFDSSGPDGKVRGTPAQIIEKYTQLHRDAQLSGDRVNAENFAQHAEHYTRILAEAQREIDKARDEQEQFNRDRQAERDRQIERDRERQAERQGGQGDRQQADRPAGDRQQGDRQQGDRQQSDRQQSDRPVGDRQQSDRQQSDRQQSDRQQSDRQQSDRQQSDRQQSDRQQNDRQQSDRQQNDRQQNDRQQDRDRQNRLRAQQELANDPAMMEQPELPAFLVRGLDMPYTAPVAATVLGADDADSGLVETPEAKPRGDQPRSAAPRAPRPPRAPRVERAQDTVASAETGPAAAVAEPVADAAPEAAAEKPRTPRPRKPKPKLETGTAAAGDPAEAAE